VIEHQPIPAVQDEHVEEPKAAIGQAARPQIGSQQWLLEAIRQLDSVVEAGHSHFHLSPKNRDVEALYRLKYLPRTISLVGTAVNHLRSIAKQKGWL
jgi:hypothetical protein